MSTLNAMLDVDIKKMFSRCISGAMLDSGKKVSTDDIAIITDRVMYNLRFRPELLNLSTDAIEKIFYRVSMGEFINKMGTAEPISPTNVLKWMTATYANIREAQASIEREKHRESFDKMCQAIGSPQAHPASKAATWLIRHRGDIKLNEMAKRGLTREHVYALSYERFNLDSLFYLHSFNGEYVSGCGHSAKLAAIVAKGNRLEMAVVAGRFNELPKIEVPVTREQIEKLDKHYGII